MSCVWWCDERGGPTVEFALLLPVLILILFGTIEFGLAFYSQEVLTNASREGARAGIVQNTPKPSVSDIQTVVNNYLTGTGINPSLVTVTVVGAGGTFPNPLTVTVTYNYLFLVLPRFSGVPSSINLTAQTVMRHE